MSYSSKASKKDEQELKAYTAAVDEQKAADQVKSVDSKGLQKELDKRSIDYSQFAAEGQELFRKKSLKDDYEKLRAQYQWPYDLAIE